MALEYPVVATQLDLPKATESSVPLWVVLNYNGSGAPALAINKNGTWIYQPFMDQQDAGAPTAPFAGVSKRDLGEIWTWDEEAVSGGAWLSEPETFAYGVNNTSIGAATWLRFPGNAPSGQWNGPTGKFNDAYIVGIRGNWTLTSGTLDSVTIEAMHWASTIASLVTGSGAVYGCSYESGILVDKAISDFRSRPLACRITPAGTSELIGKPCVLFDVRYKHPTWT